MVAEVRREAFAWRGEASHSIKGALRQGKPVGEMGIGGQGRGEPVAQPPDFVLGGEGQVV